MPPADEGTYDPVDEYAERPYDDAKATSDENYDHGFLRYEDPDHHTSGNMKTVEIQPDDPLLVGGNAPAVESQASKPPKSPKPATDDA